MALCEALHPWQPWRAGSEGLGGQHGPHTTSSSSSGRPHPSSFTTGVFPNGGRAAWLCPAAMMASPGVCGDTGWQGAALGTLQQPRGSGGPPGRPVIADTPGWAPAAIAEPAPPSSDTRPGCPVPMAVPIPVPIPVPMAVAVPTGPLGGSKGLGADMASGLPSAPSAFGARQCRHHHSAQPPWFIPFFYLQKAQFLTGILRGNLPQPRPWWQKPAAGPVLSPGCPQTVAGSGGPGCPMRGMRLRARLLHGCHLQA